MIRTLLAVAVLAAATPAFAAETASVTRAYASPQAFIATSVSVPPGYATIYLSGLTPTPMSQPPAGSLPTYGTTEQQADSVFERIETALAAQGAGAGDIVSMRVYLVGDPAKDGKMDFAGMMAAYGRHFGTATQPNKPSRTTVQVVSLAGPGMLVEIDAVAAVKPH